MHSSNCHPLFQVGSPAHRSSMTTTTQLHTIVCGRTMTMTTMCTGHAGSTLLFFVWPELNREVEQKFHQNLTISRSSGADFIGRRFAAGSGVDRRKQHAAMCRKTTVFHDFIRHAGRNAGTALAHTLFVTFETNSLMCNLIQSFTRIEANAV